ncbi:MAG TPA: outer membrane lipoprotein LolB [Aquabacterium sp.]|nr:outer membrane lipoprotein LolB [Aquabacterium sp.]
MPALAALALVACATPPRPATPGAVEVLSGRLLVRVDSRPPRSVSAQFELTGTPAEGALVLSGPLGATAAQARWARGEATLKSGDKETRYPDLDSLAEEALGERIPIAALFDWLRGRPWSGSATVPRRDGTPGFEQLGWRINLARSTEGWVEAERQTPPAVLVRAKLDAPH